jgi:hypothetical protein
LHMPVQQKCALVVHDTDVHAAGMQVDTAGKRGGLVSNRM